MCSEAAREEEPVVGPLQTTTSVRGNTKRKKQCKHSVRTGKSPATSRMAFRRMQSLVGAAGEALGLTEDPLATLVGLRIEETVEEDLDIENWDQSNSDSSLSFEFRTGEHHGLLLYSDFKSCQYLEIKLVGGQIRARIDTGYGEQVSG